MNPQNQQHSGLVSQSGVNAVSSNRTTQATQALASAPTLLNISSGFWIVEQGDVDIFAVALGSDNQTGARRHICRIERGEAVFSLNFGGNLEGGVTALQQGLIAVGNVETYWTHHLARPSDDESDSSENSFNTLIHRWLNELSPSDVLALDVKSDSMRALREHHTHALHSFYETRHALEESDRAILKMRLSGEEGAFQHAIGNLASILVDQTDLDFAAKKGATSDPLTDALQLIIDDLGVSTKLVVPSASVLVASGSQDANQYIEQLAAQANVSWRWINFTDKCWWESTSGPLLAFKVGTQQPVAVLQRGKGYITIDMADGISKPLTEATAGDLDPVGLMFYRNFDAKPIKLWSLALFGLQGTRKDRIRLLFFGLLSGLLGLMPPLVTGSLIESVIPSANVDQLTQVILLLLVTSITLAAFSLTTSIATHRIEARIGLTTHAAIIDRLINLPIPFFRDYSAGDLALRANGIESILEALTSTVQSAILGWIFGLSSLIYLFIIDFKLALLATALVSILLIVTFWVNYIRLKLERPAYEVRGAIASFVLQALTGIAKIRGSGSEKRAFSIWADKFAQQKRFDFQLSKLANLLSVFDAGFVVICSLVLFAGIAFLTTGMSTSNFIVFNSAFAQFLAATVGVTSALTSVLNIIPLYERSKPILQGIPERSATLAAPGQLTGSIEISKVKFRYAADGPLIVDDVSIKINPGEFVAFVGPSGSGKSTIFRLLLGFEKPESGAIYLDGQDLSGLNIQAVRRQLGVVLQNGKLMPGSIYSNIVGASPLSHETAMEAARLSGMEDDINNMPMGLHTMIAEGASTISGGQKQRLMVARAIVKKPKILLFDEATSALDNRTQAIVAQSVSALKATRIVIAHRLSTVIDADKIYVISGGKIVESGNYSSLIELGGHFFQLAKRQTV